MRRLIFLVSLALALVFSAILVAPPALADKPAKAEGKGNAKNSQKGSQGKQKGKGRDQGVSNEKGGHGVTARQYFSEENRTYIHKYYSDRFRSGHCPPGLANLRRVNGSIRNTHQSSPIDTIIG